MRALGLARIGPGLFAANKPLLPLLASSSARSDSTYSNEKKYLKNIDTAHLRRGRGGRCSFSGVVCTIFGGNGFIGRYIANNLGKTGSQLIFPYRGEFYFARNLKLVGDLGQVLFTRFNLADEDTIAKAVKHSNVVINCIGRTYPTRHFSLEQVNVEGAARIARVCKKIGVERFIHFSMLNVDRPHKGHYIEKGSKVLASKAAGEAAVRSEFPEAIIIRPSDVYGQEDEFLQYYASMWRSEFRYFGLPNAGRGIFKQPVYVGDIAAAVANIALNKSGTDGYIYQAVGPRRYELRDIVQFLLEATYRGEQVFDGATIVDNKYYPMAFLKSKLNDWCPWSPIFKMTTDKLERETVTDIIDPKLPTLVDLGIELTKLEDRMQWEVRPLRQHGDYLATVSDFGDPPLPKFIEA